jgi:hypothetical protein
MYMKNATANVRPNTMWRVIVGLAGTLVEEWLVTRSANRITPRDMLTLL